MAIVQVIEKVGEDALIIEITGFTADAEYGTTLGFRNFGFIPSTVVGLVKRTAGSTAVVSVKLQRSIKASAWGDILTIAASDESITEQAAKPGDYWRCLCTTVGAGNTLTVRWILLK